MIKKKVKKQNALIDSPVNQPKNRLPEHNDPRNSKKNIEKPCHVISVNGEELAQRLQDLTNNPEQTLDVVYNLYSQFDNAPFTDQKQIMRLLDEAQKDLEYNKRAHELNQDAGIDYDTTTFLKTTNHAIDQIKFAQNYFQNKDNFDAYQQKMTSKNVNLLEKEQFTQNTKTITPQAPIQMQPSNDTSHPVEIVQRYKKEIENAKFSNSTPYSVVQKTKPDATDNSLSTESPGAENKKEAPNPFSKNPKPYS